MSDLTVNEQIGLSSVTCAVVGVGFSGALMLAGLPLKVAIVALSPCYLLAGVGGIALGSEYLLRKKFDKSTACLLSAVFTLAATITAVALGAILLGISIKVAICLSIFGLAIVAYKLIEGQEYATCRRAI